MKFNDNFTPTTITTAAATSSSAPNPQEPDDISAFLRQLLHRSSSSNLSPPSSSSIFLPILPSTTSLGMHAPAANNNNNNKTSLPCFLSSSVLPPDSGPSGSDRAVLDRSQPGYFPVGGGGSLLSSNNEYTTEECDYESEEGVAGEAEERRTQSRNQSKRTRAAEVHNLSEKRRRSKINEKMKALQMLIPNSNKTDKASMLDEAIEYLKQLQLQVQMLSMRNGVSLHPMCLPEDQGIIHAAQLSQIGMHNLNNNSTTTSFDHINLTNSLSGLPDTSHSTFNLANRPGSSTRPSLSGVADVINSETVAYGLDSCVHPSFRSIQNNNLDPRHTICREPRLPQDRLLTNKHEMKSFVITTPLSFGVGNSSMEGHHNSLETHIRTKSGSQGLLIENILGHDPNASSIFSGLHAASSGSQNDKLTDR